MPIGTMSRITGVTWKDELMSLEATAGKPTCTFEAKIKYLHLEGQH